MKRDRPNYVYFLRPIGAEGPVKIGTSREPGERITHYQLWSPLPLEMAAMIAGGYPEEAALHAKFAHLHSHHEWFRAAPELTATINAIQAGTFDIRSLPGDGKRPLRLKPPGHWPEYLRVAHALTNSMRHLRKRGDVFIPQAVWNAANLLFVPDPVARDGAAIEVRSFLDASGWGQLDPYAAPSDRSFASEQRAPDSLGSAQ